MTIEAHPNPFTEHLIALREQYQTQLSEYERRASHVREQLNHINALLVDQFVSTPMDLSDDFTPVNPISSFLAIHEGNESATKSVETSQVIAPTQTTEIVIPETSQLESTLVDENSTSQSEQQQTLESATPSRKSLDLLPPYQGFTKLQAVQRLLHDHQETPFTINEIIQKLYGDLDPEAIALERERMQNTITRGKKQKIWQRAPGKEARFTLATTTIPEKEAKPSRKAKSSQKTKPKASRSKKSQAVQSKTSLTLTDAKLEMNATYASKSLAEAVKKVMQAHPGEVMNTRKVATLLYPDLDETTIAALKQPLNLVLSKGYLQGKWERMPDKKGDYLFKSDQ